MHDDTCSRMLGLDRAMSVSRVVNHHPGVSFETRDKLSGDSQIELRAQQGGEQPDFRETQLLGLIVPDVEIFFLLLSSAVLKGGNEAGIVVV